MSGQTDVNALADRIAADGQKLVMSDNLRYVISPEERDQIVAALRRPAPTEPVRAALEKIHDEINALGGRPDQDNSYDQGIVDTVNKVLEIIEKARAALAPAGETTGELFNRLVGRINLDGINPRSLTLGELEDAIEGASTKPTLAPEGETGRDAVKSRTDREGGFNAARMYAPEEIASPQPEARIGREEIARRLKEKGFTSRDGTVVNNEIYAVIDAILALTATDAGSDAECTCSPMARYTDAPHEPGCSLSRANCASPSSTLGVSK